MVVRTHVGRRRPAGQSLRPSWSTAGFGWNTASAACYRGTLVWWGTGVVVLSHVALTRWTVIVCARGPKWLRAAEAPWPACCWSPHAPQLQTSTALVCIPRRAVGPGPAPQDPHITAAPGAHVFNPRLAALAVAGLLRAWSRSRRPLPDSLGPARPEVATHWFAPLPPPWLYTPSLPVAPALGCRSTGFSGRSINGLRLCTPTPHCGTHRPRSLGPYAGRTRLH